MEHPQIELASLVEYGVFNVTLEGERQEAFFTHKPAVYYEWIYGVKEPDGWIMTWQGFRSQGPVIALTPAGQLVLRVHQLRLYLAPVYSRIYSINEAKRAPEPVKKRILQEKRPMTVEEYRLDAGKSYHAQVEVDQYSLPPHPEESYHTAKMNVVLAISDLPFVRGQPQRPVTPSCLNLTY